MVGLWEEQDVCIAGDSHLISHKFRSATLNNYAQELFSGSAIAG